MQSTLECQTCHGALTGRQAKYCKPLCATRAKNASDKVTGRGAAQRARTAGKRAEWQNKNRGKYAGRYTEDKACKGCAVVFTVRVNEPAEHCSSMCVTFARNGEWPACKMPAPDNRTAFRRALDEGSSILDAIYQSTAMNEAGCREWQGTTNQSGYARINFEGKNHLVHRLAAAEVHGDLSHMPVHHKCANKLCVNTEHLQVITPQENTAEMFERHSYIKRIATLEDTMQSCLERIERLENTLRELDPGHEDLSA